MRKAKKVKIISKICIFILPLIMLILIGYIYNNTIPNTPKAIIWSMIFTLLMLLLVVMAYINMGKIR